MKTSGCSLIVVGNSTTIDRLRDAGTSHFVVGRQIPIVAINVRDRAAANILLAKRIDELIAKRVKWERGEAHVQIGGAVRQGFIVTVGIVAAAIALTRIIFAIRAAFGFGIATTDDHSDDHSDDKYHLDCIHEVTLSHFAVQINRKRPTLDSLRLEATYGGVVCADEDDGTIDTD